MPALQKVKVKKIDRGEYRIVGKAGRTIKLLPKDQIKYQSYPIGAEFDVMVPTASPASRLIRRAKR